MTAKKQRPTNTDLHKEIAEIKTMIAPVPALANDVKQLKTDVTMINKRHELIDAGKAAVSEYKQKEKAERDENARAKEVKAKTDLYVKLAILAVALTTLVITLTQAGGH